MDVFSKMEQIDFPFDNHSGVPPIEKASYQEFIDDFEAIIAESQHMLQYHSI